MPLATAGLIPLISSSLPAPLALPLCACLTCSRASRSHRSAPGRARTRSKSPNLYGRDTDVSCYRSVSPAGSADSQEGPPPSASRSGGSPHAPEGPPPSVIHSSPSAEPGAESPSADLLSGDELGVHASLDALLSGEDLAATVAGMGPELVPRLRTVLAGSEPERPPLPPPPPPPRRRGRAASRSRDAREASRSPRRLRAPPRRDGVVLNAAPQRRPSPPVSLRSALRVATSARRVSPAAPVGPSSVGARSSSDAVAAPQAGMRAAGGKKPSREPACRSRPRA